MAEDSEAGSRTFRRGREGLTKKGDDPKICDKNQKKSDVARNWVSYQQIC